MKSDKLILFIGAVLGLGVLTAAVVVDEFEDGSALDSSGQFIAEAIGAGAGIGAPGLNAPQLPLNAAEGRPQMQQVAIPGLTPFSAAKTERFSGNVTQVAVLGSDIGWGQVHATIVDSNNGVRLISLAPIWFLQNLGCRVAQNDRVTGIAFRFDAPGPGIPLYARIITINGRPCQLRSDEGIALWSNRLGKTP
ncbi:Magnetosome protein MamS [Azospirillaceae bacterium]